MARKKLSKAAVAEARSRLKEAREAALAVGFAPVALVDDDTERRRQTAIATRQSQRRAYERAIGELGRKLADPREDPEEIQDGIDDLQREVFRLQGEIDALTASASLNFPSASEIANVSHAVGVLDARVGAAAAAGAIMNAAADVLSAWST